MNMIQNQQFDEERALYHLQNAIVENCRFEGDRDGESFLKESANLIVKNCFMDLRYPMWHDEDLQIIGGEMTNKCRAALWYGKRISIENCLMNGIKALRECDGVVLKENKIDSPEFAWRCKNLQVKGGRIASEYAFFECQNLELENLNFTGKYSFQYTKNLKMNKVNLKTKDAFWHTKNATVSDCLIEGEYLGWYSEGLTLINCHIKGTQPLCYCKRLKLINCTMEDCDLSFEYSDVEADLIGMVQSVKNPLSGRISADEYGEIILKDSKYPCIAKILKR